MTIMEKNIIQSIINKQSIPAGKRTKKRSEDVETVEWKPDMSADAARKLYIAHSSPETVPQGKLITDMTPKQITRAVRIMLAKPTLKRKLLPIKLNLDKYRSDDFKYDTTAPLKVLDWLKRIPLDEQGMKFIHEYDDVTEDYCVLFYGIRHYDFDYDDFVKRVDISRVGDCFRNVLGINTEVLRRDEKGRATLQIERIAALAQPDYSAFLGKDELDVYKLEWMEYSKDEVRNWMRTVCSPNASTVADDGYLSFSRSSDPKGVKIEFVARQQFPLPRVMRATRVSRWPWFRTFLAHHAYQAFWGTTVDNILSRYAGIKFWIGRGDAPNGILNIAGA